jgi:dihydroflavonol-4-reductase
VDTGLNVVHVDDVAQGHLLAYERGEIGESYILGGENRTLRWILEQIAGLAGSMPPRLRLPVWLVLPLALVSERMATIGVVRQPIATVDELRMSQHYMYFSSEKAKERLGYRPRPAIEALRDALAWFVANNAINSPNARNAA